MAPDTVRTLFFGSALLTYLVAVFGSIIYLRWQRKTKWPFKESDRLLRSPGEGLKRRVIELDEKFVFEVLGALVAIPFAWAISAALAKAFGLAGVTALVAICGGILCVIVLSAWRVTKLWKERSNHFLGWFGERLTAEKLQPLQERGYQVFHDFPAEPGKKGFNIDHVVVGPTGVSIVEVKTRRKGNARAGRKEHEVIFDGTQLDWPWGLDRHGVQQAINEASWLKKWIFERTGLNVTVKAVLTLPGWYVREAPSSAIRVVNPSFLPDVITGRGDATLSSQNIDLIARQLDQRCRDVED
ncbi:MAG TPA: nuclease-related domain-containing protein [Opitutaceae bacterium]